MTQDEFYDYVFYIIDLVALIIALIFSLTDAHAASTEQLIYKLPLVGLSMFFKYIYLCYYAIVKFVI